MAGLNIFGKKDGEIKKAPKKEKTVSRKSPKRTEDTADPSVKPEEQARAVVVNEYIVRPHITEKATDLSAQNRYVFVVAPTAAKKEIGYSVEKMYGVKVESVRIINVHPKKMRLGRSRGIKKGYKKAIVQVKEGQSIEILPS